MLSFANDYQQGAHPKILERLCATNFHKTAGYGLDPYCQSARQKIAQACHCPSDHIFFLMGGTQSNQIIIDCLLAPYTGVLAAQSGHISQHEAGAIEYTGHKVLTLPNHQGKIWAKDLGLWLKRFYADVNHEHMVAPGLVYLSQPTEYGTLYSKRELSELSATARDFDLGLFVDGARLGYALGCPENDLSLEDLSKLSWAISIGATKVGALCGEAAVFSQNHCPAHFATRMKQHGALLAKGRLLGLQFDTLFEDNLYTELGRLAVAHARRIRQALQGLGLRFLVESPSNQLFFILQNEQFLAISQEVELAFWESFDEDHCVVRLATSWATSENEVTELLTVFTRLAQAGILSPSPNSHE